MPIYNSTLSKKSFKEKLNIFSDKNRSFNTSSKVNIEESYPIERKWLQMETETYKKKWTTLETIKILK